MDENLLRFEKNKLIVFWDFETFNLCLNFCHNLPWQVGMLKVKGNEIIDSADMMVKWNTHLKISQGAAIITKYSQFEMDRRGVPPEKVYPKMRDWLDEADYIIGHNILGFDINLVYQWYYLNGHDPRHLLYKMIDTNLLAKGVALGIPYRRPMDLLEYQYKLYHKKAKGIKTNLTALGREYGIEYDYDNLHNSIIDLGLNLKVWNKLKFQVEI